MESSWLVMVMSVCIGGVLVVIFFISRVMFSSNKNKKLLPPGPPSFPIITNISWLRKSSTEIESILRDLHRHFGPVVTLRISHRPTIFVADRILAHHALVRNGALFADRPPPLLTTRILSHNQHTISSASNGPTWRLLRRNLTSEILHPSRIKSYSKVRTWALHLLLNRLINSSTISTSSVNYCVIKEHLQYAMFCLMVLMCFGDLDEPKIKEIETAQTSLILGRLRRFNILNFWPNITKILLRNRWKEFFQLRQDQEAVLIPLIEARRKAVKDDNRYSSLAQDELITVCYVDTLLDLRFQENDQEDRKLEMGEIVSLCSEFLNAGTDTTSIALEWIMANILKHPHIQDKLYEEMKEMMMIQKAKRSEDANDDHVTLIQEEDLEKLPYLKAVILEGLRRHPPGHFVLPHAVTDEEVVLGGYIVPKNATINFMVAEIGLDPNVWEDPMAFKPERFLSQSQSQSQSQFQQVDITGSKEIKMMPFGAGRRICPGYGLSILHLEYFVANLVWRFQWKPVNGDEVDLSEKQDFMTSTMQYPLKARLFPRSYSS